ncbi:methylenetetrahydrofolate reductase [Thermodesulfobacteriota bacterium]
MSLKDKIKSGQFTVIEELEPPKGSDFSLFKKNAELVKGRVDAFVVPEMANAVMKAGSLGGCAFLQKEGMETVFQVCCRDRNRLAIQADILTAGALGIPNIMAVPGEDIHFGDHPKARSVIDLDPLELIETISTLQNGKDLAGIELAGAPEFFIGALIDTNAPGGLLDIELEKLEKKIDCGIEFIVTNPIFDIHSFKQFTKRVEKMPVAVIPTVLLLKSAGMARYIDRNIKNIAIPSEMIREIQKAPDKQKQCIQITAELINEIKGMGMAGVMISTAGWEDKVPKILDQVKT